VVTILLPPYTSIGENSDVADSRQKKDIINTLSDIIGMHT